MITYSPPKSQVWGHQVGRLSAVQVVERGMRLLDEKCVVTNASSSELTVSWTPAKHPSVAEAVKEIDQQLGAAAKVAEIRGAGGLAFRQQRWPVAVAQLPAVAIWLDRIPQALTRDGVVVMCSTNWVFEWREKAAGLESPKESGGMFGIHLSQPHRITTMFHFHSPAHYAAIKEYLRSIGLVELSDKHVRPKGSVASTG